MHDVARLAQVSVATVSNHFRRPGKLSDETRRRVQDAVDLVGFVHNGAAQTLRTGSSAVVGYLAFELASGVTPLISAALERRLAERGMHLLMAVDVGEPRRELEYLRLFEQQRLAGVVVAPVGDVEAELGRMRGRGIPSVLSARRARGADQPSVSIDHVAGGALAAEHLLALGRRRIAFAGTGPGLRQVEERRHGAVDVLLAAGLELVEDLPVAERTIGAGVACGEAVARRRPEHRPDAVFCANDLLAAGLVHGLLVGGVDVPGEIAVVGYDDIDAATLGPVPLTTVHTPHEQMGEAAAELLLAELDRPTSTTGHPGPSPAEHRVLAPALVVRKSSVR